MEGIRYVLIILILINVHFMYSISDLESPNERIAQVVKWFMSAFHAGRKGSVAKKPYNPILGETLRCWWDLGRENGYSNGNEVCFIIKWCLCVIHFMLNSMPCLS